MAFNTDGLVALVNQQTGLGTSQDHVTQTEISDNARFYNDSREYLDIAFCNSWQCRKVCEYIPKKAGDTWGDLSLGRDSELSKKVNDELESLKQVYTEGQIIANIYGGSTVIRWVEDGQELDQPIDYSRIKSIEYSRVYDKWEIIPDWTDSGEVYDPEYYLYYAVATDGEYNKEAPHTKIHKSRVIRFRGNFLPPQRMRNNLGWEDSILVPFIEAYTRYFSGIGYVGQGLKDFETLVISIDDFMERTKTTKGLEDVLKRLTLVKQQQSTHNAVTLDKETESLQYITRSFTNLEKVLGELRNEMIAASGLTRVQFYQEHPTGLQNTGESERVKEAAELTTYQSQKWGKPIDNDIKIKLAFHKYQGDYTWKWKSSYLSTPSEEIDKKAKIAEMDDKNMKNNVYTNEEVRASRYSGSQFQEELTLKQENIAIPPMEQKKDLAERFITHGELIPNSYYELDVDELEEIKED